MPVQLWPFSLKQHISIDSEGIMVDVFWTMSGEKIEADSAAQMIKNFFGLE